MPISITIFLIHFKYSLTVSGNMHNIHIIQHSKHPNLSKLCKLLGFPSFPKMFSLIDFAELLLTYD